MYRSKKSSRNIPTLKDPKKGRLTKDPVRIPSIFNEHFASVGRNLASYLPSSQGSYMDYLAKSTSPASSFFFQPVTEAEVRLEILSIPNGKSHGLYSCPTQMLKHAHQYLRTFAPKSSYSEIFFISPLELVHKVLTPKMKKKNGGHRLCFGENGSGKMP